VVTRGEAHHRNDAGLREDSRCDVHRYFSSRGPKSCPVIATMPSGQTSRIPFSSQRAHSAEQDGTAGCVRWLLPVSAGLAGHRAGQLLQAGIATDWPAPENSPARRSSTIWRGKPSDMRKEVALPFTEIRKSLVLFLCLFMSASLMRAGQEQRQTTSPAHNPLEGAEIFRHYCAACHGTDGRGHGPASVTMRHAVPDLTRISQRNGGTFPFQRVRRVIEGEGPGPLAHGNREMPIWGPIFHEVESDLDLGEVRLDAITKHLESMQQK